jgi:hypothetical protein
MAMLAVIATAFSILVFSSLSSVLTFPAHGYWNPRARTPTSTTPVRMA